MKEEIKLHALPYKGTNNRKKTKGRLKVDALTQSIPVYEKDNMGRNVKLLGYNHVYHAPAL